MGEPGERNNLTRRQFLTIVAGAAIAVDKARRMAGRPPQLDPLIVSDNFPKPPIPIPKSMVPQALSVMMGPENAILFETDARRLMKEYDVSEEGLRALLAEKTDAIGRAAHLVKRYFSSPVQELCYISSSLHVSAWIHGIDPLLMHAIAHVESNFSNNARSPANAMGCMQVTLNSAIFELHSMNRWRSAAEQMLRRNLEKLGGMEFLGLFEEPRIQGVKGRLRLSKEDDAILMARPLQNAIWGARTLLLKYRGGRMGMRDWQIEREKVKGLLRRYKGIDEKADWYANNAYHCYRSVYCQLDPSYRRPERKRMLAQDLLRRKI